MHDSSATRQLIDLGRKLAAARQAQGLSLDQLADRLRLGASQLEALESADRTRLPEDVFVIAQARRVAASLGVDADRELEAVRSSQPHLEGCPPIHSGLELDPLVTEARRPGLRPALLVAGIGLGLALVTLLIHAWGKRQDQPAGAPARSSAPAAVVSALSVNGSRQAI